MDTAQTFTLADHYDRHKIKRTAQFRPMTKEEGLSLRYGASIKARDYHGSHAIDVRPSGKVRTWKRDPDRIEIPCKFGMYESGTFNWYGTGHYATSNGCMLVVQVSEWIEGKA
jgi:hypothetical protein